LRSATLGPLIKRHLHPGESLLDVGGGTGFFAKWLSEHAGVAATVSDIVDYNGSRDRTLPFIHQPDPRRVPCADGSFDVVMLMFVLHHIETPDLQELLLREATRVARKRVIVIEDTPVSAWDWRMNKLFDWILNIRHGIPTPFTFRSAAGWSEAFSRNRIGLTDVKSFRSVWPSFGLYRQSMFILGASRETTSIR
jgi:ubiquinone/menaquinone biosynthesis C-methylase UbiE